MARIENEVQRFVKSYGGGQAILWKVVIPDGHGGQLRKQGFLDKSDATKYAVQQYLKVLQQQKGLKPIQSSLLFREYSLRWLDLKSRDGVSEATVSRYKQEIDSRLNPYFGHFKLSELEKVHMKNFIYDLQTEKNGSAVVQYAIKVFKGILKQAEIDDLIASKGIALVPTPKHRKKDARYWDSSQMTFFLNAIADHELFDLWKTTLFTGMRAGEIAGLQWDCIHFDKSFGNYVGAIEIKRMYNQKTRELQDHSKTHERRVIPIFPEIRDLLQEQFKKRSGPFVFGGEAPLESSHFNRQLQSALKKLNAEQLPEITFHGLRHSFCSYLDSTGMSRRVVAGIMGHRDLNTTNRYSHVSDQTLGYEVTRWVETQSKQKTNNLKAVNF